MTVRRVLAVVAAVAAGVSGGSAAVAAPAEPQLRFVAAARSVTVDSYPGYGVDLDLGTNMVAGKRPFEVRVKRASYGDPIVAQIVNGSGKRAVALPAGLVTDFGGFPAFTHVTITDAGGAVVLDRDETFCPNSWNTARTRPDAPDTSPYPQDCPFNPFTIGAVWGIQAGWSAPTAMPWWQAPPVDLAVGTYTAMVRVNQPYLDLFGIPVDQASVTIELNVREYQGDFRRVATGADAAGTGVALTPGPRPAGKKSIPKGGPRPDLRSLPAWGIQVGGYGDSGDGRDYLSFAATVWVAGRSPLVVDGFRRSGEDVMDAYQYFYDARGKQTGYAQVGTMEWDAQDGHHHWHFTDFAQYRLLDENAQLAVRSGKEAFCLANTDAVDYTLPEANWRPGNTDLHTACGDESSLAVREVLDVGSGDTYAQYLPGQSFDITDLPNGTYYVEVAANPDGRLYESDTTNNSSLRKVILGGEPGARTVDVPPHQGIVG